MTLTELCLSVRVQPRRGPVRGEVEVRTRPEPGAVWLIYIHGHNNPEAEALAQWEHVRDKHLSALDLGSERVCAGPFLWPSDRAPGWFSKLTYPQDKPIAVRSGRLLASYLRDKRPQALVLVGHSLGAVVALEAVNWLGTRPDLSIALLAAAVRVDHLRPFGDYAMPHARAVREAVTYSPRDSTLKRVFGPGEWLASPADPGEEAVGLRGEPKTRPWAGDVCIDSPSHRHWEIPRAYEAVLKAAGGRQGNPISVGPPEHPQPGWRVPG
jgi:hypothetical protein